MPVSAERSTHALTYTQRSSALQREGDRDSCHGRNSLPPQGASAPLSRLTGSFIDSRDHFAPTRQPSATSRARLANDVRSSSQKIISSVFLASAYSHSFTKSTAVMSYRCPVPKHPHSLHKKHQGSKYRTDQAKPTSELQRLPHSRSATKLI